MTFTAAQTRQLLRPINRDRVLRDGKGHSHVSQQDVVAHLIRVFGFGAFDIDVTAVECVFEAERVDKNGEANGRWDCCYRAMVRLTVRDPHGREVCHYEDGSTATAQNQTRGDAHDLAYKSAISLSKKRAAINLGDQFGLSLYNRGQLEALVKGTLVTPDDDQADEDRDMQDGVPRQVTLGNDEVERDMDAGLPRNKNGSISRSRVTDAELAEAGSMTSEQKAEHNALVRSGSPDPNDIEHLDAIDPNDPWATDGEPS
jgi:recombination DNA repair RAD52 pathway protein